MTTKPQATEYAIVIERAERNYAGYVPDLPGVVATGESPSQVKESLREGAEIYIELLRSQDLPVPPPSSAVDVVAVQVA